MKTFYFVVERRALVVEAESEPQALDRRDNERFAKQVRASAMCRFSKPVEAADLREAWKKFQEGPAAGLLY